ncbi:pseudaminic acid cytidylyltransferase [Arsukibacterium sp.]|uniref:pseudaminic acid cytidylyltransferase n=1 Tax=Arsukibacterium sp. TaxID=1977258 RepID=UPI001BD3FCEA
MITAQPIAVIPARAGSKRIPGKNSRSMLGIPLITRSIRICQESGIFESVVVSTDSEQIADLARGAGAQVHKRPADLSDDHTPLMPVIAEATVGYDPTTPICCFYATAVTVNPGELVNSWQVFEAILADPTSANSFLTAVVRYPHPIQRALEIKANGELTMLSPEYASTRTQDLPERWHDAGAFIWGSALTWSQSEPALTRAHGFPLPHSETVDLDTEEDWARAETLLMVRENASAQAPDSLSKHGEYK